MKPVRSSATGFTLVEMLIVLSIVGVLAAIALPSFKSLMQGQRIKNASFEMYALLSFARSEALKRNQTINIVLDYSGSVLERIEVVSVGATGVNKLKSLTKPKGVDISTAFAATVFHYQRNGRTVEPGPIAFQLDVENESTPSANVRCIKIELSGMPRTVKGACS